MQTLSLSLRSRGDEGEPLPTVFSQLEDVGVRFRRGWLHLVAAAPGGGKSALTSFMVLNMSYPDGSKVPTLYLSPDNDVMTFGKSALAPTLNVHTNEAERRLHNHDNDAYDALDEATDHLWVSFQAGPSPFDIREEMDAFATVYGDYPHQVVIDNLMDVDGSEGGIDERTSHDAILDFLKRVARETGAAIYVLAHVTGEYTDGLKPIPRSALMQKIDKRPQLILTLFKASDNTLGASVVKHRSGRAQSDGTMFVEIPWVPERAWFGTGR